MILRIISGIGLILAGLLFGGLGGCFSVISLLFGQGGFAGLITGLAGVYNITVGSVSIIRGIRNAKLSEREAKEYCDSERKLSVLSLIGILVVFLMLLTYHEFNLANMITDDSGFTITYVGVILAINAWLYFSAAKQN